MKGKKGIQRLFVVVIALSILSLNGCGGFAALPKEKISEGDKAMREAKESNASLNAPVELKAAEDKLAAAKAAFNKKDYDEATRLAEQASVDADFARAKGSTAKARKKAEETRQNIKTLRQEIEALSKKIALEGGK
jgi:predicted S18 family serine protease